MEKNKNKGFTLLELIVTILMVAVLAAMGGGYYHSYLPKAQASEAVKVISLERIGVSKNMQAGACI